ncbi:uncharacterized protein TNCV_2448291 [Trichonephila clavipes]|uniref:Uncharacterized protein n=1 Tax=Trichonephila clavipes TaxID=2585209 RepID=A0A8X6VLR3_TRICX|nr:uncharacterized protein TNCV_2448291 [Trichonephila clavipes]
MVDERLPRNYTPVTTVDELWHRVEATRESVPVHGIQSLFGSMPRRISAVITARCSCSGYLFLRIYAPKFLENLINCYFQRNIVSQ